MENKKTIDFEAWEFEKKFSDKRNQELVEYLKTCNPIERSIIQSEIANNDWSNGGKEKAKLKCLEMIKGLI